MGRRSATNARYQKNTMPAGKTRRSASSAKPSRATASPTKSSAKPKGKGTRPKVSEEARQAWIAPDSAQFRKLRRIWWAMFVVAVVLLSGSFVAAAMIEGERGQQVGSALSWICLAVLAAAFYLDLKKIRPIREAAMKAASSTSSDSKEDKS